MDCHYLKVPGLNSGPFPLVCIIALRSNLLRQEHSFYISDEPLQQPLLCGSCCEVKKQIAEKKW